MKDSKNQRALDNFEKVRLTTYQNLQQRGGCCETDTKPPPPPGGNNTTGG